MDKMEKPDKNEQLKKLGKIHGVLSKIAKFIIGDNLNIQFKEYKVSFSYLVDNTVDYLKLTNVREVNIIKKVNQLKNINNTLLERLFDFWLRRNKQLLYWHIALLLLNITLLIINGDNIAKLSSVIVDILVRWKSEVVSLYCS
ncbi:MAG: hypothetical protein ACTJLM_01590 [Ehrlichia sp.]